jgi:hypothetical protein
MDPVDNIIVNTDPPDDHLADLLRECLLTASRSDHNVGEPHLAARVELARYQRDEPGIDPVGPLIAVAITLANALASVIDSTLTHQDLREIALIEALAGVGRDGRPPLLRLVTNNDDTND